MRSPGVSNAEHPCTERSASSDEDPHVAVRMQDPLISQRAAMSPDPRLARRAASTSRVRRSSARIRSKAHPLDTIADTKNVATRLSGENSFITMVATGQLTALTSRKTRTLRIGSLGDG